MGIYDYNFFKSFLDMIRQKLPGEANLADFLAETLHIGKEAAYRRMREDVPFTLRETLWLSRRLRISLDAITEVTDNKKLANFCICLTEFENSSEIDYKMLQEYVDIISLAQQDSSSSLAISANVLPQPLYLQYGSLSRFFLFKWIYYSRDRRPKAYGDVTIPEGMSQIFKDSSAAHRQFKKTSYILDRNLCLYLVNDIKYFASIDLIEEEGVRSIQKELHELLDHLEEITVAGTYENGNEVHLYISSTVLDTICFAFRINDIYMSVIQVGIFNSIASTDKKSYETVSGWIDSQRQLSTLVTQSGEQQQRTFFAEQRRAVDSL